MNYVASKNGKVVCRETCSYAKKIKPENQVKGSPFNDIVESIIQGCRPGKCCLLKEYTYEEMQAFYDKAQMPMHQEVIDWYSK